MSHFTVLVIGDDPEGQLAPYDENMRMKPYLEPVDVKAMAEYYKLDPTDLPGLLGRVKDWCGCEGRIKDGVLYQLSTYNVDSKWDWYQLGGRWRGFFKLKTAGAGKLGETSWTNESEDVNNLNADTALKKDIDFDGMRDDAEKRALKRWERAQALLDGKTFESWETILARNGGIAQTARDEYYAQEGLLTLSADNNFHFDADDVLRSREQVIADARNSALSTFAVVKNGEWFERGEIGWWACVVNEKEKDEWNAEVTKLLDGLPDDTLLSVYDCHI